ncbi:MAG: cytochrome bd-I oxidase subunit CydX [Symbiopectobacterium sp.]
MWYFAWILGTMLACALSLITALAVENQDMGSRAQ